MTDYNSSSSLADILAASGHVGYYWDLKTDQLIWFGAWQKLFGADRPLPPHNAETFAATIVPDDHRIVFGNSANSFDREYRLRLPDGRLIWVHETGTTEQENGRTICQRGMLRIIEGAQRRIVAAGPTNAALERDPLTGRPSRSYMLAQVGRLLEGPKEHRNISTYLVVSIDKMAFVNEAVGTKSADILLRGVADRLAELIPTKAILARVGGDMFGILLPGLAGEAQPLSDRILKSFTDRPVTTPDGPIHVTVSIGGARLTNVESGASEIMIRAEQALNDARQRGRNQYVVYQESTTRAQEIRAVLELGERVKQALKHDKLRLAFQPVIDAQSGDIVFYEALARMFGDDGQLIPAAQFIPVVEQQGLAVTFDRHVLDIAVRELESHASLVLAVNISGLTAAQAEWPEHVQRILGSKPDVAKRLIIEITETAAIMDVTETKRFAELLKKLGGQVALDDFGAGFTSIRHLRTLSLAIMKIDRELLLNLVDNPEQEHLVRMLISIAHGLNLRVVAEGVETEDVAQWLRREKVDMMQGYYFGKPSLDRPWLELKGTEAHANRAKPSTGNGTADKTNSVEARNTSFMRA